MALTWLDPAQLDERDVAGAVAVLQAVRQLEAPHEPQVSPTWFRAHITHGWDGEPPRSSVYRDDTGRIVAVLEVSLPTYDNTHMAEIELSVDPVCWRRGIGSELFEIGQQMALDAGRTLIYAGSCA